MLTVSNQKHVDWANMPINDLLYGCAMDCDFTKRIYPCVKVQLEQTEANYAYNEVLSEVITFMASVEHKGVRIDTDYLKVLDKELSDHLKGLIERMNTLVPQSLRDTLDENYVINFDSTRDIIDILFSKNGFNLPVLEWNKKSKLPSTKEDVLKSLRLKLVSSKTEKDKEGAVFLDTYAEYKKYKKYHRDYVVGVEESIAYNKENRVYSQYNFSNVKTGRLSNSSYNTKTLITTKLKNGSTRQKVKKNKKGIPFHTLPRTDEDIKVDLRSLIVPDEGKALVVADYATAEVRAMAHIAQEKNLIKAFLDDEDLHTYTACLVFNKKHHEVTKKQRQIAKSVTFLILYGGGPKKLAAQTKISLLEAKSIFAAYHKAYPGISAWTSDVRDELANNGYVLSLFGRARHLENVNSPSVAIQERAYRQAVNFIIQSSASDLMLHAIYRLRHMIRNYPSIEALDIDIIATVHDSLEVQCPKKNVAKVAKVIRYCMSDLGWIEHLYNFKLSVPFKVDVEVGMSFGKVKPVKFDSKGNVTNKQELLNYIL